MALPDRPASRPDFRTSSSFFGDFRRGFSGPFHALSYVASRPHLWKYSLASAAVLLVVLVGFGATGVLFADDLLGWVWARPTGAWMQALWWVALVAVGAVTLVASFAVTLVIVGIVLGPFMDKLSERVEVAILNNAVDAESTFVEKSRDFARGIYHPLMTLGVYVVLLGCAGVMNLVPVAGTVAAALVSAVASASLLSMEFADPPQSRRGFRWREKLGLLRAEPGAMLGLGAGVMVLLLVPVLDFFLVPIAIVAGTMVFCGLDEAGRVSALDRRRPRVDGVPVAAPEFTIPGSPDGVASATMPRVDGEKT